MPWSPPPPSSTASSLEPVNGACSMNQVLVDVVKGLQMKGWSWMMGLGPDGKCTNPWRRKAEMGPPTERGPLKVGV